MSPQDPSAYFEGRQRQFQVVVQGSFKRRVRVRDLRVGQLWDERLQQPPPPHVKVVLDPLLNFLQPSLKQDVCGDHPHLLSPAFATLQTICLSDRARAPDICDPNSIVDDVSPLDERLFGMTALARKNYFSRAAPADEPDLSIDPSLTCTFDFYSHAINLNSFELLLGFFRYCVSPVLGPRLPIMHLLLEWDGQGEPHEEGRASHAYCLQIWRG